MDYYECVAKLAEITAARCNKQDELKITKAYMDEFTLEKLKVATEEATTLEDIKYVILDILDVMSTGYVR